MITLRAGAAAPPGAKSFGLIAGLVFFALAVLAISLTVRKRLRPKPAALARPGSAPVPAGSGAGPVGLATAHLLSTPASSPLAPAGLRPAGPASPDPLDRIAKLAQLRDSGALTNEEFEAQRAKLLAEM